MGASAQKKKKKEQRYVEAVKTSLEKALAGGAGGRLRLERPLETPAVSAQKIWWWDQLYPVDGDLIRTDVCRLGQATVVRPADPTRRIISKKSGHKSEGLRMGAAF